MKKIIVLIAFMMSMGMATFIPVNCSQEFANVSNDCGGLATGGYAYSGYGVDANAFDGDWDTLSSVGSDGNLFINYTQPTGTLNATLKYKVLYDNGTNETVSAALPAACVNSSLVSIWLRVNWRYIFYCLPYDGTYEDLLTYHQFSVTGDSWSGGLYEENITWIFPDLEVIDYGNNSISYCEGNINYIMTIFWLNGERYNFTDAEYCIYGCEGNICNASLVESRTNSFYLIILLFAAILIVAMIAKFYR